jgi:hypothetical protein
VDLSRYGTEEQPGAAQWAGAISRTVKEGSMPPWLPDPRFDDLLVPRRLSGREVRILTAWARSTPAETEPEDDAAEAVGGTSRGGFTLAEPDLVVEPGPGESCRPIEQGGGERHEIVLALERSRWITGIELLPSRPRSLRRTSVYLETPGGHRQGLALISQRTGEVRERRAPPGPRFLTHWLPGDRPMLFPETSGLLAPAGSSLLVEIFFAGDGVEPCAASRLRFGLILDRPRQEIDLWLESQELFGERVRRREGRSRTAVATFEGELTLEEDIRLVALCPVIGGELSSYEVEVEDADSRRRTLLLGPEYRAEWSSSYPLADPLPLPAGTTVRLRGREAEPAASSAIGTPAELAVVLQYVLSDHLIAETPDLPPSVLAELGYDRSTGGSGGPASVGSRTDVVQLPEPQLFRADNGYHLVEGSIAAPGVFRLRVGDLEGRLLDPRNFAGQLVFEGFDELSSTFVESHVRLRPLERSLWARVPRRLPLAFHLVIRLAGEQRRFDFDFEEPRAGPLVRREASRPVDLPAPLPVAESDAAARRELLDRMQRQWQVLDAALPSESWPALSGVAQDLWQLGMAASGAVAGLGPDERGRLRIVCGELARAALALYRAAEGEERYELRPTAERLEAAVSAAARVLAEPSVHSGPE